MGMSSIGNKVGGRVLSVGEKKGFRAWRFEGPGAFNPVVILRSCLRPNVWQPGIPMTGDPNLTDQGVYLTKTYNYIRDYMRSSMDQGYWGKNIVFGEAEFWGTVVEHQVGYRAAFCKPVCLYNFDTPITGDLLRDIAGRYNLPILGKEMISV